MMRYRLPLELELTILELATPSRAIDSLHDRVNFFIRISLVHRSLTAWAQERPHDQFLYTYRSQADEHERLKARFEAGFSRDRSLRRLYLDFSHLPSTIPERREPGTDSVSADTMVASTRRLLQRAEPWIRMRAVFVRRKGYARRWLITQKPRETKAAAACAR